jgi:hypothetical protein
MNYSFKTFAVLFIIMILSTASFAQLSFVNNGQQLNKLAGRGVLLSDFNGDGFLDAFVVNENGPEGDGYCVYFGNGDGQFNDSSLQLINPIDWSGKPDIGDINGDGRLEVVTGRTIWFHDSNGNFSLDTDAFTDSDNAEFGQGKLADLNGDSYLDFFTITFSSTGTKGGVYLNNGHGQFSDTGQRLGNGSQAAVELGDLNGDGYIDAVITGWRENSSNPCPNRIWINDGHGNFSETGQALDEAMRHVHGQTLGDIDNDGDNDIVFSIQTNAPYARIYRNDGTGYFTVSQSCGTSSAEKVKLGDMDGDGDLDMVLACNGPNEVWLNNGGGTFTDSGLRLGSEWSWGIDVGDLNGDGKLDVFAVNMAFDYLTADPWYIARGRFAEVWLNTTPTTSIEGENSGTKLPNYFQLDQNYPNPFNPSTNISFSVGTYSHTSLRVYDMLGREVATLVNEQKPAGRYTVQWNAAGMSSGVYFYKLQTNEMTLQKKMILIR